MRHQDDDLDGGQDNLQDVRENVRRLEDEIRREELKLSWNQAVALLGEHPGWQHLVAKLQRTITVETAALQQNRMDEYELGYRQGALGILATIAQFSPLHRKALDEIEQKLTVKRAALDEERALLR